MVSELTGRKDPGLWGFILFSLGLHLLLLLAFPNYKRETKSFGKSEVLTLTFARYEENQALSPPRLSPFREPRPWKVKVAKTPFEDAAVFRFPEALTKDHFPGEVSIKTTSKLPLSLEALPNLGEKGKKASRKSHHDYLLKLLSLIERAKVYPLSARMAGYQGRVGLSFVVEPDGRVEEIKVILSSGYKILDRAAVETVKRASPFPPPPKELAPPLKLSLKVSFVLEE